MQSLKIVILTFVAINFCCFGEEDKPSLKDILRAEEIKSYEELIYKQPKEWLITEFGPGVKYPINLTKATKNIVWQVRDKIRKGEMEPIQGIIRTLWYTQIKPIFARTGSLDETKEQSDTLHSVLTEMVRERRIMRYKDMGFLDHNQGLRKLGRNWHVMLIGEKHGKFGALQNIAQALDCTFLTLGGKPSLLSTEYLVDEYKAKGIDIRKSMYLIFVVDYDMNGWIIRDSIMRGLKFYGMKNIKAIDIIFPDMLTQEELDLATFLLPKSEQKRNEAWVKRVGGIKDEEGNIYGFESDSIPFPRLKQKIIEAGMPYVGDPEIIRRANTVSLLAKELNLLIQNMLGLS